MKIVVQLMFSAGIALLFSACNEAASSDGGNQEPNNEKVLDTQDAISGEDSESAPQITDERVKEIKTWYAEVQKLGMKDCVEKTKSKSDGLEPEMQFPFDQKVKTCQLSGDYELVRGEMSGYEWGYNISIYKKNGKIFFVFIEGGAESWMYEKRYYCDNKEQVIRHLEKEGDQAEENDFKNQEIPLNKGDNDIHKAIKEYFEDINFVLEK